MNQPLLSIALCTYNGEKFLEEQLTSIVNQDYRNLEIIVVDDCSTDGTVGIIKSFAQSDSRIKYFTNDQNLGFNKNFEKALRLASGEYIAISDQDDVWLPFKLPTLLNNIGDSWLVASNSSYIGSEKTGRLLKDFKMPKNYCGFLFRNYVTGHTVLMKRQFLEYVLPFPQQGFYDWWMGFVAVYHHKISFCDEVLTQYRVHDESVIQKRQYLGKPAALVEFETNVIMLNAFADYKNLEQPDQHFIKSLKKAYELKASGERSMLLVKMVYRYYRELFPNRKPWKSLTKLIFAYKFSKGIKVSDT